MRGDWIDQRIIADYQESQQRQASAHSLAQQIAVPSRSQRLLAWIGRRLVRAGLRLLIWSHEMEWEEMEKPRYNAAIKSI